jgi:hypothetical protein
MSASLIAAAILHSVAVGESGAPSIYESAGLFTV